MPLPSRLLLRRSFWALRHPIRLPIFTFYQPRTSSFLRKLFEDRNVTLMSTCRGCLVLRAFRPRYTPSQSLYGYRRFFTARCSRSLPAASTVSHHWNRTPPGNLRQPRNFSSTTRLGAEPTEIIHSALPVCCPGCGAYSQTVDPNQPGYYSKTRKETRKRIAQTKRLLEEKVEEGEETVDLKTEAENAAREIQELTTPSEDEEGTTKRVGMCRPVLPNYPLEEANEYARRGLSRESDDHGNRLSRKVNSPSSNL